MADPTSGNWGSAENNPLGGSRSASSSSRRRATGPGFYNFLQDQLNRSGGLRPRSGTTSAYKGGELDGMDQGQAESHLADKYGNMEDDEAKQWEPPVAALPHEVAQGNSSPSPASTFAGPPATRAPDASRGDYGANPDADLARLRTAGVIGDNQTISDPAAFKAAVANLDAKSKASTAPAPTTGRIGAVTGSMAPTPVSSQPAPVAPSIVPPIPTAAVNSPPPVVGGSINGAPADQALGAMRAQNPSTVPIVGQQRPNFDTGGNLVTNQPPAPVIGTGVNDTSATAMNGKTAPLPPYSTPNSAGSGEDIDPETGKKRTQSAMA